MFFSPEYSRNISLCLSEILDGLGVNEEIVLKRRRAFLLAESVYRLKFHLENENTSAYIFGSQIEGTTTLGLNSDVDYVVCYDDSNVIQNFWEWEHGLTRFLMLQDDNVSPGYCMLQWLRNCGRSPCICSFPQHHVHDGTSRVLLKNTYIDSNLDSGSVRNGPSHTTTGKPGVTNSDYVPAFPCKKWPINARRWLDIQGVGMWPTQEIRQYCRNTKCFVVATGHKGSDYEVLEWRISTSLAERCLMFSLNITQLRCYVLMKMIIKTYIEPYLKDTISSFMCKTILFYCVENTHASVWREDNLLGCLMLCVFILYKMVETKNCPHFFIQENNLMAGKILVEITPYILEKLRNIVISEGRVLLGIECDNIGAQLEIKIISLNGWYGNIQIHVQSNDIQLISGSLLLTVSGFRDVIFSSLLSEITHSTYEIALQTLKQYILKLIHIFNNSQGLEKTACELLTPVFCAQLGSVLASHNIQQYNNISQQALTLTSFGLNSDVSAGKLKLASMLYCVGDIEGTERVLRDIEDNYDLNIVLPASVFCPNAKQFNYSFSAIAIAYNEEAIPQTLACCVRFLPCEINCIPHELRHEMFRSTQEDRAARGLDDKWMDWAAVDSLPFLYFLQYQVYGHLLRHDDRERAFNNLVGTIVNESNLGHRETVLNLLGQCMEQEQRARDAFICYLRSLNLRPRNNAARFHICRLLSSMINSH